ncbi:hypothetical protein PG984_000235 [Apiospora sp. TS-2023a]
MATEQAVIQAIEGQIDRAVYKAVSKAMKDDEGAIFVEPVSRGLDRLSLSDEIAASDRSLAQDLHMPRPILCQRRKLRKVDNDIKREKKRKRVRFDDEETDAKRIKVEKSQPSSMSATEQPQKKAIIKRKNHSNGDTNPKLVEQIESESEQGTKKRLGPLHYYTKLRERLAARDGLAYNSSNDAMDESKPSHEYLNPETSVRQSDSN